MIRVLCHKIWLANCIVYSYKLKNESTLKLHLLVEPVFNSYCIRQTVLVVSNYIASHLEISFVVGPAIYLAFSLIHTSRLNGFIFREIQFVTLN